MNPSDLGDIFSNSNEPSSSFDLNSPFVARSGSGLSRPRFVKVRKSYSSMDAKSPLGSGFNPFGPRHGGSVPASSGSGLGVSGSAQSVPGTVNEAFLFGRDVNLSSGKSDGGKLGEGLVEEMMNLRVESGNESVNAKVGGGFGGSVFGDGTGKLRAVEESMGKLNIESSRNVGSSDTVELELQNELKKKLNIKGGEEVPAGNDFVFGSEKKGSDSFVKSSVFMLPEQMMNLGINNGSSNARPVENNEVKMKPHGKEGVCFESTLSDEMGRKLKIEVEGSSIHVPKDFSFRAGIPKGDPKPSGGVSSSSGGTPFVEFKTPNPKSNLFPGVNQHLQFTTKSESIKDMRGKRRKGKLKQPSVIQVQLGEEFVSRDNSYQETHEAFGSYSPMDISPCQETSSDNWHSKETSVASDESFSLDDDFAPTESQPTISNAAVDDELVAAAQRMDLNGDDVKFTDSKEEGSEYCSDRDFGAEGPPDDSISGVETESFKSAAEEIDFINDITVTSAECEASSSSSMERKDNTESTQIAEDMVGSNFTFAASSAAEGQLSGTKRNQKKKNSGKLGPDVHKLNPNAKVPYASSTSSTQYFSYAEASFLSSPRGSNRGDLSGFQSKTGNSYEVDSGHDLKKTNLASVSSIAAQEACEKWRLRGNQAYAAGDLSKAEHYYTEGVNCVSRDETSHSCLKALMLCHSNRAATRMSLGRMRNAIEDCLAAAAIDPHFLKVQVRAANCYLALGEVEHSSRHFKECLQSYSNVIVDRKISVEASDGLQKAQRVSECLDRSAELLKRKSSKEAETALELIAEALLISSYSERLLEVKAEALFMLQRYEEVIQLCEETYESAEKNGPQFDADDSSDNMDTSETSEDCYFRLWRSCMIFNSYFRLGRLEEAIASLEKQEERVSITKRNGSKFLESSIPLAATVRKLLHHKAAGNEAFLAGRHAEAIEHYTTALSCNLESHNFAAICFGNRAAAYQALSQITDAIADCSLAISLDGNYLKAISRRATLFETIRDYGQAANDLRRLVTLLSKQVEAKANQPGVSERSITLANDLRQANLRLSEIEEKARKEIPLDMYLILGVEPSVSASEIRKAYRKAALRHHPDKAGQALARIDNGVQVGEEVHRDADRLFKMIGEAYAVLSDPTKRACYDSEEDMRNTLKKHHGNNRSRTHAGTENYPYERSGSMRQGREGWRSSAYSNFRASEATRSSRY